MIRFDTFKAEANEKGREAYESTMLKNGASLFYDHVKVLQRLAYKLNAPLLRYLFGQQLGDHLASKSVRENDRDLLAFFGAIDDEYVFFTLYELKTNPELFAHC